ncbi:uncharacterized protein LOC124446328 [Xenia sp. Carnegie-2017]|uniref:uncharacterized protein LOC124446328 n=1 Tax=Xenia sp. Carnegie-2017 TaxID=2897299 RepID=UPI001F03954C|nr:uncharacterized protein LOC124446328 [Xenia sp. Carnegie-2017]
MPLTAAQRQAKSRQKLKDTDKYEEYKKKNAEQQRIARAKKKIKEDRLPTGEKTKLQAERRKHVRARVAACRARKKQPKSNYVSLPTSPASKSALALGRAVSRANRAITPALPHTTKRKRAVVQKLSQKLQVECGTSHDKVTPQTIARKISGNWVNSHQFGKSVLRT